MVKNIGGEQFNRLCEIIREADNSLSFTIFEIGARPLGGREEPFHKLLEMFPGSQIIAFEVDKILCEELNKKAKPGLKYFPVALGRTEDRQTFYETSHPMCCSLYKPNDKLISSYNNMEVALLKSVSSIETLSMDYFVNENNIESVDFIKIDIQGAELDVFQGGIKTLNEVIAIVSEVEFLPIYIDQPLFGDVCAFLSERELMFHKFLSLSGRAIKPIVVHNDPNFATQHLWADAVYIKDIAKIPTLSPSKLMKLGLLAFLYGSPDISSLCFKNFDEKNRTAIRKLFFELSEKSV